MSDEPSLTSHQINELKALLEKELTRLARSMAISDEAARPVELDQTAVGRLSRMDSLQSQGMARNLKDREEATLALVQAALRRIDDGTYGRCVACAEAIPFGRLLIMPEAPTCAGCG
jgi:DnaK suppressor protein